MVRGLEEALEDRTPKLRLGSLEKVTRVVCSDDRYLAHSLPDHAGKNRGDTLGVQDVRRARERTEARHGEERVSRPTRCVACGHPGSPHPHTAHDFMIGQSRLRARSDHVYSVPSFRHGLAQVVDVAVASCRRADRATLADALLAELSVGRRRLHVVDANIGNFGRAGQ